MANQHRHSVRGLRGVSDELWADFTAAVSRSGSDRSAILRRFMEWYVKRDGAKLPERPVDTERGDGM